MPFLLGCIEIGTLPDTSRGFSEKEPCFLVVPVCVNSVSVFLSVYTFLTFRYYARMTEMKQGTPEEAEVRKQLVVS